MLIAALLFALQNAEFQRQQSDEKARLEILDYRGRVEHCEWYDDAGPSDWRCPDLKADATKLKVRFKDRPDLLRLLEQDTSKFQRPIIVESHEWARPIWSGHVEHVAFDDKDREYRFTADSDGRALKQFTLKMPGSDQVLVITPSEVIAYPDLQSIQAESQANIVTIEMKFDTPRPWCFVEPDGQPELHFTIKDASKVEASITRYEGCVPQSRDVQVKVSKTRAKSL